MLKIVWFYIPLTKTSQPIIIEDNEINSIDDCVDGVEEPLYGFRHSIYIRTSWVRLQGPVIQANGRLTFEDDLRSGGLI